VYITISKYKDNYQLVNYGKGGFGKLRKEPIGIVSNKKTGN